MRIDSIFIEVIVIFQIEKSILISSQSRDGLCLAISLGFAERKLAEITCCCIIRCCVWVVAQKIERKSSELKMASSSKEPNVQIVGNRQYVSQVLPCSFDNSRKLFGIGVYIKIRVRSLKQFFLHCFLQIVRHVSRSSCEGHGNWFLHVVEDIIRQQDDVMPSRFAVIIICLNMSQASAMKLQIKFVCLTTTLSEKHVLLRGKEGNIVCIPYLKNIIIIMNDSISSSDDKRRPITLFNEINAVNTEDWKHEQFQFSPHGSFHQSFDRSHDDNSFANDLPIQSKICHSILQAQDAFQINFSLPIQQKPRSFQEEQKSYEQEGSNSSNSNVPSQVTITLHEQSLASKGYEKFQTQDDSEFSTSLKSFLSLNDKNYKPHLTCMKFLFNKLKEHSRQSLDNLKLYINFFEIKMKQEAKSLIPFELIAKDMQKEDQEEGEQDELNMDERVLISQIKKQNLKRQQKRKQFHNQIQEIHDELISLWRKCKQKRQKRQRIIEEEIIRVIDRIELQMEDMIKCRLFNQKEKSQAKYSQKIRSHNPYLTKDKYLQMKYLIQRQNAYLKLITDFNGKIITYMISMFSKEEVQINREIKEALSDYANAYVVCYDLNSQILDIKINKAEQLDSEKNVKLQLADKLLTLIPKELYDINENSHKFEQTNDKLQAILGDFSNYLQNTIFLSTIQMNNEFIIFRNEANWKTSRSFFEKEQNCIDYQSKQALANSKSTHNTNIPSIHSSNDLRIVVVLTSNYYLHLQNEDKIATVKLGDVKLSKRGREIIISDKGKGFGSYFGMKTQLGRLEFETTQEVEIFAEKLSLALRRLSYS